MPEGMFQKRNSESLKAIPILVLTLLLATSPSFAYAAQTGSGLEGPVSSVGISSVHGSPVDCTKQSNVVAFDVTHANGVGDLDLFAADIKGVLGHDVGTWSVSAGAPPACVSVLVVYSLLAGDGCMSHGLYTAAEAATIKAWVDAGHGLFLTTEHTTCDGTGSIASAFAVGQAHNSVTDSDEFDHVSTWPIYGAGNLAVHTITSGVSKVVFFLSESYTVLPPTALITTDLDLTASPSGVPVAGVFLSDKGCVVTTGDADWMSDLTFSHPGVAAYSHLDNAAFAKNIITFLKTCGAVGVPEFGISTALLSSVALLAYALTGLRRKIATEEA